MAAKQVTSEDLYRLRTEITSEQATLRHGDRAKMQDKYMEFDDLKETTLLLSKSYEFMNKEVQEIKQIVKDGFISINTRFDNLPTDFVRRHEYEANEEKIKRIESIIEWTAKIIIGSVILALLGLLYARTGTKL